MKTIFIFKDERAEQNGPHYTAYAALGEDGAIFASVAFDRYTVEHFRYAFGCQHALPLELKEGVSKALNASRRGLFAAYDKCYGEGNWMPMWLDAPAANPEWVRAMAIHQADIEAPPAPRFSDETLARIFAAVTGAMQAAGRVLH
ncbi:hypothetical protein [Paraburkholderia sp. Ac-20347]|uniref:hypothetical protein n=1 Tax=Paraburkholderia sp. Ac-20347 TaxID=2703892 RepID=UPI00197D8509|nr:hypothetical protein [Paraburkholderia sp. Ac-20347]MBN3811672.1 hypothetical protein [Paraburkholderia sp. Ac-20347]